VAADRNLGTRGRPTRFRKGSMNQTTSGNGFGVTQIVVLIVPVVAGCFLLAGYLINQIWARNERRAKAFAEALAAVENYLEMPYRVRRRLASDPQTRAVLTNQMSDIKAQIAFHQAWLQVEAHRLPRRTTTWSAPPKKKAAPRCNKPGKSPCATPTRP
jgi:hypothetical protein